MHYKLEQYSNLITKFNKTLNLVSPKDIPNLMDKHFSDGVESARIFMDIYDNPNEYSVYDLGSGNGIPGIIWAILMPTTKFFLVEIDERKAEFLKHCKRTLALDNLEVLNTNFYDLKLDVFDIYIARAFMNIDKLYSPGSPASTNEGFLIKGSTWNNEMGDFPEDMFAYYPYTLKNGQERTLLWYKPKN